MANYYWLDDWTTLDLTEDDGDTDTPVAGIQDVTVVGNFSIDRHYTSDSVKIQAQKRHEFQVNVQIGYSNWDVSVAKEWLGGAGSDNTDVQDTSDPQKYSISGTFESTDHANQLDFTVTGITFEEMPIIDASRGEFVQWDLDGTGEDITGVDVTSVT